MDFISFSISTIKLVYFIYTIFHYIRKLTGNTQILLFYFMKNCIKMEQNGCILNSFDTIQKTSFCYINFHFVVQSKAHRNFSLNSFNWSKYLCSTHYYSCVWSLQINCGNNEQAIDFLFIFTHNLVQYISIYDVDKWLFNILDRTD